MTIQVTCAHTSLLSNTDSVLEPKVLIALMLCYASFAEDESANEVLSANPMARL